MADQSDVGTGERPATEPAVPMGEHRELLDKLAQQSRLFDATLSAISDFAYSFDRDGRFTYVNKALLDLWGLTLNQAVGKDFYDLRYPDELAAKLQRQILQVFDTGRGLSDETPYTSPTGKSGYYEYIFSPVFNTSGAVEAVAGSTRDITARKRTELALVEAHERLASSLLAGEIGTWSIDFALQLIFADQNVRKIFSLPPGTHLVGEELSRFMNAIHSDDREAVRTEIRRAQSEPSRAFRMEHRVVQADGNVKWIVARGKVERDPGGHPARLRGVVLDVTERKEAEFERERLLGQVQVERERLAEAFAQSPAFLAVLRGPDHIFEFVNERYYELIGKRDLIGKSVHEAMPEVQGQGFFELLDGVLTGGQPFIGSAMKICVRRQPDGPLDELFLDFVFQPMRGADGAVVGIMTHGVDVTERTRAQAALLEGRDALEAANKAKDQFLAVLSHELRTPLSPVVMTLAAMELHPELPYELREDVAMIRRNIDLETKLIDDLLDLSRVAAGKLRLHMRPIRLHEVLRHALEVCASDINAKQLTVIKDFGAGKDSVVGDAARLEQVFWNLLKNAIKFSDDGGTVTVKTSNPDAQVIVVQVIDHGAGIPAHILPRVFDAFEQGDVRNTRQFGGLGLGLAISKAVVDMHGGAISALSEGAGTGATFIVQMEAAASAGAREDAPRPAAGAQSAGASARILLVEDHHDTARTLERLLKAQGYVTRVASSVASALEAAAQERFDLLVSDIGLPDASGYELMQKLRERYGMQGIALTGYGMEDDMRRGREAGFADHVVKPVNISHLETVMRAVLEKNA